MKAIKRILISLILVVAIALGAGMYSVWPFNHFPKAELAFDYSPSLPAESSAQMLAGIAEADITAPIGIPKFGYSTWSRPADGFRNRLKTKAFYIKPKQGLPLVVVQADLPASSLLLHHRVAELIAAKTDVPPQSLSIHVTHTHSGPGQYLASDFYNVFGANKPGFDPQVLEFLSQQMAKAVIDAYEQRKPAKIAIGQTSLYGAAKNRSMGAYIANKHVKDKVLTEENALEAVNPLMTMVRIDILHEGQYLPRGMFTTFSIHGTSIPAFTKPYHGGVWAFFERDLQWQIQQHYQTPWLPLHGPFQATHGDNNPNWQPGLRGDIESRRIGKLMVKAGWQLFKQLDNRLQDDLKISVAMRELDLLALRPQDAKGLCKRAIVGAATVAGAAGDEVFPISYIPPMRRGWPKIGSDDCHKEKHYMMSDLQPRGIEAERFPHLLSLSALRVGKLIIMGLPFEVTFEAGNRIAQAMQDMLSAVTLDPVDKDFYWVVSSHTNGYFGYAVTAEEYSQQWYEGGHTLYGPGTVKFLSEESAKLVADMWRQPGLADMPQQSRFALAMDDFFPTAQPVSGERRELTTAEFSPATKNKEAYWFIRYQDVNPGLINLHEPLLAIEYKNEQGNWQPLTQQGVAVDDQGYDLQILHLDQLENGMAEYELRWFNPSLANDEYRFKVAPRAGLATFESAAFGLENPVSP